MLTAVGIGGLWVWLVTWSWWYGLCGGMGMLLLVLCMVGGIGYKGDGSVYSVATLVNLSYLCSYKIFIWQKANQLELDLTYISWI